MIKTCTGLILLRFYYLFNISKEFYFKKTLNFLFKIFTKSQACFIAFVNIEALFYLD